MKANIVDLRYKMKDVLKALARRERVEIMYRGRRKGIIIPVNEQPKESIKTHPAFGMWAKDKRSVKKIMTELRAPRYVV